MRETAPEALPGGEERVWRFHLGEWVCCCGAVLGHDASRQEGLFCPGSMAAGQNPARGGPLRSQTAASATGSPGGTFTTSCPLVFATSAINIRSLLPSQAGLR